MRRQVTALLIALLLSARSVAAEPIAVVVHPDNPLSELSRTDVSALFLGRHSAYPTGEMAHPLDQAHDSEVRALFYELLTGKPISKINAYWARLIFAGRVRPPRLLTDNAAVIQAINDDITAIGYVQGDDSLHGLKVVLTLP